MKKSTDPHPEFLKAMKKKEHSQLKEMSIWYDLSQSETLKIIIKNAYNDFTDKVVSEVSK